MIRIVAGKSCAGKTGYVMARFQIAATPVSTIPKMDVLPLGMIIHFPLAQQFGHKTGTIINSRDVLHRIQKLHPNSEIDFLYCGWTELRKRQLNRQHTEQNLMGYHQIKDDGFRNTSGYEKQMLEWVEIFRTEGWRCNFIHSHHGKYYPQSEIHFRRIIMSEESFADRLKYIACFPKPVAVRGYGAPLETA